MILSNSRLFFFCFFRKNRDDVFDCCNLNEKSYRPYDDVTSLAFGSWVEEVTVWHQNSKLKWPHRCMKLWELDFWKYVIVSVSCWLIFIRALSPPSMARYDYEFLEKLENDLKRTKIYFQNHFNQNSKTIQHINFLFNGSCSPSRIEKIFHQCK